MATDAHDVRAQLAKMDAELQAAKDKAEKLEKEHEAKRKEILEKLRAADLADVREKCKLHGFTATELKGAIKMRGRGRTAAKVMKDPNKPKRKYTRRVKAAQ